MGAVSGAFAAAATTPLDVIKTSMMCSAAVSTHDAVCCPSSSGQRAHFACVWWHYELCLTLRFGIPMFHHFCHVDSPQSYVWVFF